MTKGEVALGMTNLKRQISNPALIRRELALNKCGTSGNKNAPVASNGAKQNWIPAFAGMTKRSRNDKKEQE